jgi:hypothetical protein
LYFPYSLPFKYSELLCFFHGHCPSLTCMGHIRGLYSFNVVFWDVILDTKSLKLLNMLGLLSFLECTSADIL